MPSPQHVVGSPDTHRSLVARIAAATKPRCVPESVAAISRIGEFVAKHAA